MTDEPTPALETQQKLEALEETILTLTSRLDSMERILEGQIDAINETHDYVKLLAERPQQNPPQRLKAENFEIEKEA